MRATAVRIGVYRISLSTMRQRHIRVRCVPSPQRPLLPRRNRLLAIITLYTKPGVCEHDRPIIVRMQCESVGIETHHGH